MTKTYVFIPSSSSKILKKMIKSTLSKFVDIEILNQNKLKFMDSMPQNSKIIFGIQIDDLGFDLETFEFFKSIYKKNPHFFYGSVGACLCNSPSENYTKSTSSFVIHMANMMGCRFIGQPLVESINNFKNFMTWQKNYDMTLEEICYLLCSKLGERLLSYSFKKIDTPSLVVIHSSIKETSNTLNLWNMVKLHLGNRCSIKEFKVENGSVKDCIGCSYKTCMTFGSKNSCYFSGYLVDEVFPSLESSNALVMLCPNYNDSVSATLSATINRLTVLYRKKPFYEKTIFSVVVSGNSGGDSVSKQILNSLCINKGFILPPYFSLTKIANDPNSIKSTSNIDETARFFANHIVDSILV